MIKLSTLGVVELEDGKGRALEPLLAQPKRLALLIYLVLGNARLPHRRDSLVALFWPELDREHARAALRQAVRFLRSHLGERVVQGRTEEELGVGAAALWCDVRAFEEACETGRPEEALALYRGDFLDGFYVADVSPQFERWVDAERARLRQRAAQAAWVLADQSRAQGERQRAAEWARRAGAFALDDEAGIRRLIGFLDDLGDRAGALHVYENLALRLREEFESEPSAETRSLIADLRSGDAPLRTPLSVLIVDDDPALLRALPEALRLRMGGVTVETAASAAAALDRIATQDYDAIVTDIKMPGMDGLALLGEIRTRRPDTPTLIITGHGENELVVRALRGGACDFIQKPIDRDYFVAALYRAIRAHVLSRRVKDRQLAVESCAEDLGRIVQKLERELPRMPPGRENPEPGRA
jgi:FixJ family two-component response regulator